MEHYNFDWSYIYFQHDNDPKHKAKSTIAWLDNHQVRYISDWPAQSPDLNPIEHVWHQLKLKLSCYERRAKNTDELWERVEKAWNEFDKELCQSYQHPISSTNSKETKKVHFEDDKTDSEEDEVDEESEESTDEESTEEEEAEDEEHSLLLLENNYKEDIQIKNLKDQCILEASSDGLIIPANSSKTIIIKKPKDELTELLYNFEITSTKILQKSGVLDPCHNFIINRKSLEIRIYNRSNDSMILDPGEEIGILEKLNLKEDTIVQAYHVEKNLHLCTMEMTDEMDKETSDEDKETLETEKNTKKFSTGIMTVSAIQGCYNTK
ncbi:hypothetical protein G6F32_012991 [Rhizopus arrhizus]|nr:hypothetical protein G6F32_012991 [Rhizopus arrhizus]